MNDDVYPESFLSDALREQREASIGNAQLEDSYEWTALESTQFADSAAAPDVPLAPGFFVLANFLCDRCGIPHGSLVDFAGFKRALSGDNPLTPAKPRRRKSAMKKYEDDERTKTISHGKKAA